MPIEIQPRANIGDVDITVEGAWHLRTTSAFLDQTGAQNVEILISANGTVLWVCADKNTILRICQIGGLIEIRDMRTFVFLDESS